MGTTKNEKFPLPPPPPHPPPQKLKRKKLNISKLFIGYMKFLFPKQFITIFNLD
jgi:hypothetical protein